MVPKYQAAYVKADGELDAYGLKSLFRVPGSPCRKQALKPAFLQGLLTSLLTRFGWSYGLCVIFNSLT